jgi:hypothetical protein
MEIATIIFTKSPSEARGAVLRLGVMAPCGIALILAGLNRYRRNRAHLEAGTFEPAGYIVDLVAIIAMALGLALRRI